LRYTITTSCRFHAAHRLARHAGRCARLHGHTFAVDAVLSREEVGDAGMVMDLEDARSYLERAVELLDHSYLNEVPPFDVLEPTAENIARVVFESLEEALGVERPDVVIESVTVWESPDARAAYGR